MQTNGLQFQNEFFKKDNSAAAQAVDCRSDRCFSDPEQFRGAGIDLPLHSSGVAVGGICALCASYFCERMEVASAAEGAED